MKKIISLSATTPTQEVIEVKVSISTVSLSSKGVNRYQIEVSSSSLLRNVQDYHLGNSYDSTTILGFLSLPEFSNWDKWKHLYNADQEGHQQCDSTFSALVCQVDSVALLAEVTRGLVLGFKKYYRELREDFDAKVNALVGLDIEEIAAAEFVLTAEAVEEV